MKFILIISSFIIYFSANAQTKKETIEWIDQKLDASKPTNEILVCCRENGSFCMRTKSVVSNAQTHFTGGDSVKIFLEIAPMCNSLPDNSVPNSQDTRHMVWSIVFGGDNYNERNCITKVTIKKPEGCWEGSAYLLTFYSNNSGENGPIKVFTRDFKKTTVKELTFALNLDFEDNLAERLQKAFNHLIKLYNNKKQTF